MTIADLRVTLPKLDPRDIDLLLAHVCGRDRTWVLAHPETTIHPGRIARLRRLVARRQRGEPLPYLIGEQWFFGRSFRVTSDVLIPRPETELLVELATTTAHYPHTTIIDVGTGSGCIAVTLATEMPHARLVAIDTSPTALRIARKNARRHRVQHRIAFVHGDLLHAKTPHAQRIIPHTPLLLLANLPYLSTAEWRALPRSLRLFEPRLALDGGKNGCTPFRRLFLQARSLAYDRPVTMLLEIDPRRKRALETLTKKILPTWTMSWHRDGASRWRVLAVQSPVATRSHDAAHRSID
ncbi:peptide chain release factor N(5)-glutamine methyltransferase [Candidatus Uhrbacteria bacterium]|nr:peptide chain release factor N(5)-glutamine methyltransferase [Candidatus Uhrbacteria bacterium]